MDVILDAGPSSKQIGDAEAALGHEPDSQAAQDQPDPKVEVASVVAAATTVAAQPSADAAEALALYRSSLLEMVGAAGLYSTQASQKKSVLSRLTADKEDYSGASLLAKYVSLWSVLESPENQKFSVQALIGLLMLQDENGFVAAEKVFREIEFQTSTPAALSYVMKGIGTFLLGLSCVLIILILTFMVLPGMLSATQAAAFRQAAASIDSQWIDVAIACVAGMFGSVVSLLLRLSEFESTRGRSQMFLRLTGATLPIVGGIFGAFVASLFCAKVVNISLGTGGFSFVAIGFLCGFSERFSRSFVQLAESKFEVAGNAPHMSVAAQATVTERAPRSSAKDEPSRGKKPAAQR